MMTGTTEKYALPLANASDTFDATDINIVTQAVEDTISGLEGAHDEDIDNLTTELATTKGAVTEVSDDLSEAQTTLNASITEANNQITALQSQLAQLQTDIQQAELNLQTLQTAMSTKADLNSKNEFTNQQEIITNVTPAQRITRTDLNNPRLDFMNSRGLNEAIGLTANIENSCFELENKISNYKLLDSRDIPNYTNTNHDNSNMTPKNNINILTRRTCDLIANKLFVVSGNFRLTIHNEANKYIPVFSYVKLKPYFIIAATTYPLNSNIIMQLYINKSDTTTDIFVITNSSTNDNFEFNVSIIGFYY